MLGVGRALRILESLRSLVFLWELGVGSEGLGVRII